MGRSSHRQSWASAWVQGQLASLDLSCTRSGSRYQLRAELTANHHSQASGALWPQGACDTFISTVSSQGRGAGRAGMRCLLRSPPMSCVSQCSHDVMKPLDGVMTQIPQLWGNDFRHGRPGSTDENMIQRIKWSNFLFNTVITLNCSWQYSHPLEISRGGTPLTPRWNEM